MPVIAIVVNTCCLWPLRILGTILIRTLLLLIDADAEPEVMLAEGMEKYCQALDVDPNDVVLLVLAWDMGATEMCVFRRTDFVHYWSRAGYVGIRAAVVHLCRRCSFSLSVVASSQTEEITLADRGDYPRIQLSPGAHG